MIYVSEQHGCVYTLQDNVLLMTPQFTDGSYDSDTDNWIEVDELSLLGEEQSIQDHIQKVITTLQS